MAHSFTHRSDTSEPRDHCADVTKRRDTNTLASGMPPLAFMTGQAGARETQPAVTA